MLLVVPLDTSPKKVAFVPEILPKLPRELAIKLLAIKSAASELVFTVDMLAALLVIVSNRPEEAVKFVKLALVPVIKAKFPLALSMVLATSLPMTLVAPIRLPKLPVEPVIVLVDKY